LFCSHDESLLFCLAFDDAEDVVLAHNQIIFAVHFDFRAAILADQHAIALLDLERNELAVVIAFAGAAFVAAGLLSAGLALVAVVLVVVVFVVVVFVVVVEFVVDELFAGAIVLVVVFAGLLPAALLAASPQAIPNALKAKSDESAITFFILKVILLSSSKINLVYFTGDSPNGQSCPNPLVSGTLDNINT